MARLQSYDRTTLVQKTLQLFWSGGYTATSMDDLVRQTGVSRHGIYKEFGGKKGALLHALDLYQAQIVTPAFRRVEQAEATLDTIAAYFTLQIDLAQKSGLPGPGCLVANLTTEIAPHDAEVRGRVDAHHTRLRSGFRSALANTAPDQSPDQLHARAEATLTFATGLWSLSRVTEEAGVLHAVANHFISMLKSDIT
ncbi:TetR/AcrR family transcriptional regulator [Epibacterium ulvae]|uniref:TetR/AcrR family transcriptional regulator n=1 Tax=Epibacterium ulvae TaxID=1156985 RepID=UPI001BFC92B1|nr:TetR/AcrR family transcriptional regulator [Epibacterium ulvae]MBT8155370.1 TetR/AcrR family transcriptional regulator [Epibacterium ulvae]